jgi:hypothetical protein
MWGQGPGLTEEQSILAKPSGEVIEREMAPVRWRNVQWAKD